MANIMTYMDWRGDLSFQVSPFNEVDNLIFSQMCYADFSGVVDEEIRLDEAVEKYFQLYSLESRKIMESQQVRATNLLEKMAGTDRFRECKLSCYVSKTDYVAEKQFAAITIDLNTDAMYVAFRGTDDTLVGWKEDFSMCARSHIHSQKDALAYFEEVARKNPERKFFLGGHSKGGNLAVYAAIMCKSEYKDRIIRVYNNDGPGFRRDIINTPEYHEILPKIRTIVPESSIVGMLLEHEESYTVVRSNQSGGMQHDAMSWEVLGRHFIYLEHTSVGSKRIDSTITAWLESLTEQQMTDAVDAMFSVLMAAGFSTVSSIQKEPLKNALSLLREMNHLDTKTRKYITTAVGALVKEGNKTVWSVIPHPFENEDEIEREEGSNH